MQVYIVFTIVTQDAGDDFIMERVFSNELEAYKHSILMDFKHNTEFHTKKNHSEWKNELKVLESVKTLEEIKELTKKFHNIAYKFLLDEEDPNATSLPTYRSYVKKMTVDGNKDESQTYGYC